MIYILYSCDHWHTKVSKDVIGVFTRRKDFSSAVFKLIKHETKKDPQGKSKEELKEFNQWLFDFFMTKNQTQGLPNFEIMFEIIEPNNILI